MSTGWDVSVLAETSVAVGAVLVPAVFTVTNWLAVALLPELSVALQTMFALLSSG